MIFRFLLILFITFSVQSEFTFAQRYNVSKKPDAAVAPVAAIGNITDAQRQIVLTTLESQLSRSYNLISRREYNKAEEKAFEELTAEQCTAEQCIRKIQEILQIDRFFVLQVIREENFTQISLTLIRSDDRVVHALTCDNCSVAVLNKKVDELVSNVVAKDLGQKITSPPTKLLSSNTTGQIFISSKPTGAQIFLDGNRLNKVTDNLLENIPTGSHLISLEKGDLTAQEKINVINNQFQRVELDLKFGNTDLFITSKPYNGKVILDGKEIGNTPVQVKTVAGNHKVEISKEGFSTFRKSFYVSMGKFEKISVSLEKPTLLRLEALTDQHALFVDDFKVGFDIKNPEIPLSPGKHKIELTRQGFKKLAFQVNLKAKKLTKLNVEMEPAFGILSINGKPKGAIVSIFGGLYIYSSVTKKIPATNVKLPVGNYKAQIFLPGYMPKPIEFEIEEGKEKRVEVVLDFIEG